MRPDPPVRPDGRCYVCPNQRTAHRRSKPLYRDQAERDPFCSTKCARDFHGVPLPPVKGDTESRRQAALEAAAWFKDSYPYRETA